MSQTQVKDISGQAKSSVNVVRREASGKNLDSRSNSETGRQWEVKLPGFETVTVIVCQGGNTPCTSVITVEQITQNTTCVQQKEKNACTVQNLII